MSTNLTKSKVLPIKGLPDLCNNDFPFGTSTAIEDLGFLVSGDLSWSVHNKQRAVNFCNTLFFLRRSLSATTLSNKTNAYISYVVPISSYRSSLWKLDKSTLSVLESRQRKAVMWILNTNSISYKDMLMKSSVLPLSLYQKLHVILLFAKILI